MAAWSDEEKRRCRERCAEAGDPPCFELDDLPADAAPCDPCRTGVDSLEATAARASMAEDHSLGARSWGRGRHGSIPKTHGVEGRNFPGD